MTFPATQAVEAFAKRNVASLAIAGIALLFLYLKNTSDLTSQVQDVNDGKTTDGNGDAVSPTFEAKLTGYWPYKEGMSAAETLMEGRPVDAAGKPINTVQMFQAGKADYVSVSGDDAIFPYGQRIEIDVFPGIVFRVVDTGSHFSSAAWALRKGYTKIYRVAGREPLDIAVDYGTRVPSFGTVTIIAGDNWASQKRSSVDDVNYGGFQGQDVVSDG